MRALVVLLTNAPELHPYVSRQLYNALATAWAEADLSLVMVATWWLGGRPRSPASPPGLGTAVCTARCSCCASWAPAASGRPPSCCCCPGLDELVEVQCLPAQLQHPRLRASCWTSCWAALPAGTDQARRTALQAAYVPCSPAGAGWTAGHRPAQAAGQAAEAVTSARRQRRAERVRPCRRARRAALWPGRRAAAGRGGAHADAGGAQGPAAPAGQAAGAPLPAAPGRGVRSDRPGQALRALPRLQRPHPGRRVGCT